MTALTNRPISLSTDSMLAYIPIDRRHAMARGVDLPGRAQGTALFADVSGFTPLTEALANELGPMRGAEELTRQLDIVYGALIAEVEGYRGSVIGFAGDAITCWFDDDKGWRASACALAMQRVMQQFCTVITPGGSTVTLAIKVSLAAGQVRRFRVGDPAIQYIDALAGATLERMAEAEHHANKGEVVASAEVVDCLGDAARVVEWRAEKASERRFAVLSPHSLDVRAAPWPPLPLEALDEEQVRPWLLPVVYERLLSGQGEFLAEIRPAVALFVRFDGIDYDADETAGEKLDAYVRWVQSVVTRYEGALIQLTIGDKGSFLYAAFGAPIAHDDDPSRAVAAALELRSGPPHLDYICPPQIGISRGRMRTGAYGGPTCRTYGVLGDKVNLAARLMTRAEPGQILVSPRVVEAACRHFDFEEIGPITVKGKEAPVVVSSVVGRVASATTGPLGQQTGMLVGRDAEVRRISELLNAVLHSQGQLLRIQGAAGVGKSHLSAAMVALAEKRGVKVASGVCQSTTVGTAYAPWRQIFRTLMDIQAETLPGEQPEEATRRQVAAVQALVTNANPDWLVRLPLLGDLLGLPVPENPTTAAFEPRLRQSALFDLAAEMVQTWARDQPLLLLVDDIHWMDQASQGLAVALGRVIADDQVMLAMVHRPPMQGEAFLPELAPLANHTALDLDELPPEGVALLVESRLSGPATRLVHSLVQVQTQGNPFFIEEVIYSMRESGSLTLWENGTWALSSHLTDRLREAGCLARSDGEWVLIPNAPIAAVDLGLPDSIQGVVLSRIDRLPEAHKLTLKVASVIGHTFTLDLLERCHPLRPTEDELQQQIATLEVRDFARLETPEPHPVYMFKHNVTHDVAYETLLHDQRRQLHRSVGEALEDLDPDALGQLAYHTFAGEDWDRALTYGRRAGEQAQKFFANYEAIEHFKKALASGHKLPAEKTIVERQEIHLDLGELLTVTGQYEPAIEHLRAALAIADEFADADGQARASRWIARAFENRGDFPSALDWVERGLAALGSRETSVYAEMLIILGLIHSRQGNHEAGLNAARQSLSISEKLGELSGMAFAHNLLGHITWRLGNNLGAIEHFHRSLDLYDQVGNVGGEAISHNQIANSYFGMGRWPEADHHYRQARRTFNQIGDVYNQAFADNNLGGIALNQGRLDEALAFYEESLSALEQLGGSLYVIGVLNMNLGATYVRKGEVEKAIEHLERSRSQFAEVQARDFLPEMHRHLAGASLLTGDLPQAEADARQALTLARELSMRGEEGSSLRLLGDIALSQGNPRQAEDYLKESLSVLKEVADEYELARTQLCLAKLYKAQDRHDQAAEMLNLCTATFRRLDAALELAEVENVKRKGL